MKPTAPSVPVYDLRFVRARRPLVISEPAARYSGQAARALHSLIGTADREHFAILFLNSQLEIVGAHIAGIGGSSTMQVEARTVLRAAVVACAASIVIGHNHPSGNPNPSVEDHAFTRRIVDAAHVLGIPIMDHIIVTREVDRYSSMKDCGTLPVALDGAA
jgi:DNA repair protein RadC